MNSAINVLLVEDDHMDCRAVLRMMRGQGVDLWMARSIAEAVVMLEEREYSCLLVDWHLPDGTGEEFMKLVRVSHPGIPVVVLTGSQGVVMEDAFRGGAEDFLVKGQVDSGELVRAIDHAVRRAAAKAEVRAAQHISDFASAIADEAAVPMEWMNTNQKMVLRQLLQIAAASEETEAVARIEEVRQRISQNTEMLERLQHVMRKVSRVGRDAQDFAGNRMRAVSAPNRAERLLVDTEEEV